MLSGKELLLQDGEGVDEAQEGLEVVLDDGLLEKKEQPVGQALEELMSGYPLGQLIEMLHLCHPPYGQTSDKIFLDEFH